MNSSLTSSDTFEANKPQNNSNSSINITNNHNVNSNNNNNHNHNHNNKKYRVGYWWSEKKSQKLNATELEALFVERNCEFVKIDFNRSLEEQGPFNVIVHKISDILVKADLGDPIAKKTINTVENYIRRHPEIIVIDRIEKSRALLDRFKQYRLIEQTGLAKEGVIFTPPFVHLKQNLEVKNLARELRKTKISFPFLCKPILAQGSTNAHQMCIIFNEAGLKDVKPPCVAQSFVNHNAKLFKLFVIKNKYYIMERPSLKNFQAGDQETVFFYSHDISKPNSSSSLTELDESDKLKLQDLMSKMKNLNLDSSNNSSNLDLEIDEGLGHNVQLSTNKIDYNNTNICRMNDHKCSPLVPCNERLNKIVKIFTDTLGLTFYGIDIIIENNSSRYAIIDMNTFPGYDGVENFLEIFRDVVCDAIEKDTNRQSQLLQTETSRRKPTEIDSGIEST